jgi:hypothetical protein
MQYINPFIVFGIRPNEFEKQWAGVKNQLEKTLTQYNLSAKVPFLSYEYPKQTFLQLLDALDNPSTRAYHAKIWEERALYNFLDYGHLNFLKSEHLEEKVKGFEPDFIDFIRPYFDIQYQDALLQAVKSQNSEDLDTLSRCPQILYSNHTTAAPDIAEPIQTLLDTTAQELEELAQSPKLGYISERELVSYLSDTTIEMYNQLPDYLADTRNHIANTVGQIAVFMAVQLGRADGAEAMVRQALKLKLEDSLRKDLEQLLTHQSTRNKVPAWILLAVGAVAVLFFLKYLETNFF